MPRASLVFLGPIVGTALGAFFLLGAALSKPLALKLKKKRFVSVVEVLLEVSGVLMIGQALIQPT